MVSAIFFAISTSEWQIDVKAISLRRARWPCPRTESGGAQSRGRVGVCADFGLSGPHTALADGFELRAILARAPHLRIGIGMPSTAPARLPRRLAIATHSSSVASASRCKTGQLCRADAWVCAAVLVQGYQFRRLRMARKAASSMPAAGRKGQHNCGCGRRPEERSSSRISGRRSAPRQSGSRLGTCCRKIGIHAMSGALGWDTGCSILMLDAIGTAHINWFPTGEYRDQRFEFCLDAFKAAQYRF